MGTGTCPCVPIDGSVLTAVGEILMFSVIARIPEAIKAGKSVKIQKGDSSIEIDNGELIISSRIKLTQDFLIATLAYNQGLLFLILYGFWKV